MVVAAAYGVAIAAAIVAIVDALLAYPRLPARIPMNFDFRGQPGNYGPKAIVVALFAALAIGLLVTNLGYGFLDQRFANGTASLKQPMLAAAELGFLA